MKAVLIAAVALMTSLLPTACAEERFRFKVTLEVEVDGRPMTASSVAELVVRFNIPRYTTHLIGVAPMLDLGDLGYLVVPLSGVSPGDQERRDLPLPVRNMVSVAFEPKNRPHSESGSYSYLRQISRPAKLPPPFRAELFWISPNSNGEIMDLYTTPRLEDLSPLTQGRVRYIGVVLAPTTEPLLTQYINPPSWVLLCRQRSREAKSERNPPTPAELQRPKNFTGPYRGISIDRLENANSRLSQ